MKNHTYESDYLYVECCTISSKTFMTKLISNKAAASRPNLKHAEKTLLFPCVYIPSDQPNPHSLVQITKTHPSGDWRSAIRTLRNGDFMFMNHLTKWQKTRNVEGICSCKKPYSELFL